jgi:hypothetical protein
VERLPAITPGGTLCCVARDFGRETLDSEKMMDQKPRGRDLFIVDNSVSGWTGLRYLEEWTGIARGFDVATGNFEIGALLALDGNWQKLDKIRILMGAETTHRTRKALLDAVRAQAVEVLNASIEADIRTHDRTVRPRFPEGAIFGVTAWSAVDRTRRCRSRLRSVDGIPPDRVGDRRYRTFASQWIVAGRPVGKRRFTDPEIGVRPCCPFLKKITIFRNCS